MTIYLFDTIQVNGNVLYGLLDESGENATARIYPPEEHGKAGFLYKEVSAPLDSTVYRCSDNEWTLFQEDYEEEVGRPPEFETR